MSDKRPPNAASRHASDSLAALAAGILALTGQGFLIVPQWMGELRRALPVNSTAPAGTVLFVAGFILAATTAAGRSNWKVKISFIAGGVSLILLGYLYLRAQLFFALPLLFSLAVSVLFAAFAQARPETFAEFPPRFGILVTLATGILILFMEPGSGATGPGLLESSFWKPGLFLAAALTGTLATLIKKSRSRRALLKATVIPWLVWIYWAARATNLAEFLPAACLAASLLVYDFVPWSRLKVPGNDIIGRRLIVVLGFIQTIFLVGFSLLLDSLPTSLESGMRGAIFILLILAESLLVYGLASVLLAINKLTRQPDADILLEFSPEDADIVSRWEDRIARLILPFASSQTERDDRIHLLAQQLASASRKLELEKRHRAQLILLAELSQQLEAQLDMPVSAQLAVNTLQRSIQCAFVALYLNDPERREFVALAIAGTGDSLLPPGYRQPIGSGILGRAARQRKTQVVSDVRLDPELAAMDKEGILSIVAVPLIDRGHIKGALEISETRANAFTGNDIQIAEAVAGELLRAWERSDYHLRLTELIQAGISLTNQPEPQAAVQEVAKIARQTLRARFTFVTLLDQDGNFTRIAHAGHAPRLLRSISHQANRETLMQTALNSERPFRIRDIRKYKRAARLEIDFSGLRSLIAIPIRMHGSSVGAMLAFGKQGEVFFTENDESLARLLSSQASAAIESAWLSHELRTSFTTITQLYQLSFHILKAEELKDAAAAIADAALKLSEAETVGIILFAPNREVEAEVQLSADGSWVPPRHPAEMVRRAVESQQSIILSTGQDRESICFPLKTRVRTYGALWLSTPGQRSARFITNLQTLVNQAGVALERLILLVESRQHANEIESAYRELEETYDHTLAALMSSLDARDRETEGHSIRVSKIARLLGEILEATPSQRKTLERGSLLHDIGKIGISDAILHKPGPLNESEWAIMRQHPDIGARIVEGIPFLQDTLPIIRYHQERWDGSGYPLGLTGMDIPLLARIFAVADAFDALTSDRPYRKRIGTEEATQYLRDNAGRLFDPEIVAALLQLNEQGMLAGLEQT